LSAADLRREAGRTSDAAAARRMLAIALVLEGCSRTDAARQCGMDRQTLRDWVLRYNEEGLEGLRNRAHGGGAVARLSAEQQAQFEAWVRSGPDPETDGVVRWRRVDLQKKLAVELNVELHERSVGKLLRRCGFRRLSVRPRHPQADLSAQEAHKKTLPNRLPPSSLRTRGTGRSNSGGRTRRGSVSRVV
jgi:transposase